MSYTIENKQRVITLNAGDCPYFSFPRLALFLHASASNNVHPRTFHWNLLGLTCGHDERSPIHTWNGQIMLPSTLWQFGECADGGDIKPNDRYMTGLDYLKMWKDAAASHKFLDLTQPLLWTPEISYWPDDQNPTEAPECKESYHRETLGKVWALFEFQKGYFKERRCPILNREQLLGALWLYSRRKELTGSFYFSSRAGTPFLEQD
jgi:hypothetical protein